MLPNTEKELLLGVALILVQVNTAQTEYKQNNAMKFHVQ